MKPDDSATGQFKNAYIEILNANKLFCKANEAELFSTKISGGR